MGSRYVPFFKDGWKEGYYSRVEKKTASSRRFALLLRCTSCRKRKGLGVNIKGRSKVDRKMQVLGRTVTALPGESLSASTLLSSVPALGGKRTKDEKTPEIKKNFLIEASTLFVWFGR